MKGNEETITRLAGIKPEDIRKVKTIDPDNLACQSHGVLKIKIRE